MSHLPSKYAYLEQAAALGVRVPRTLLLNAATADHAIQTFLQTAPPDSLFIIRSAMSSEDQAQHSWAGHFWSSDAVSAEQVPTTISLAEQQNQHIAAQLQQDVPVQLLLQEYIEHNLGGVLFAPWSFFSNYAQVEYSEAGAKAVVTGQSHAAILALDENFTDPLAMPDQWALVTPQLRTLVLRLQQHFRFPLDCEWAYSTKQQAVVLLQVRPQTRLTGPVLLAGADKFRLPTDTEWCYGELSESLGRLSPLSFSLLDELYRASQPLLKRLGHQAKRVDFMLRLPDGTVLTAKAYEQVFYQLTPLGGFWRGLRSPTLLHQMNVWLGEWQDQTLFDYSVLSTCFQYWLCASMLSGGAGRDLVIPHAYELTWYTPLSAPSIETPLANWSALAPVLRALFFYELSKLKRIIEQNPTWALVSWQAYQQRQLPTAEAQHEQACLALFDYTSTLQTGEQTMRSLAANKSVQGQALVINQPSSFRGELTAQSILISPYFDNYWVSAIPNLKAIITNQGGMLSHSALVAREHGIPYCVVDAKLLQGINNGDEIQLNPIQGILAKV